MNASRGGPRHTTLRGTLLCGLLSITLAGASLAETVSSGAAAAPTCAAAPEAAMEGMASSEALRAELQDALDALRREYGFPGATAAVAGADGRVVSVATGFADRDARTPMTPRSRLLAASIGKTFVAATVVSLAREDVLALDDPLARWLGEEPWFARLPNRETMTLRHLLTHTAGIADHVHEPAFGRVFGETLADSAAEPPAPERLIELVLDRPALFEAGEGWSYSDTGYLLLGLVIERASGRRYAELLRARFLEPLELESTTPSDRPDLVGLATGHVDTDNAFGLPERTTDARGILLWNPAIEWTGGGLVSTSRDLACWGRALFGGRAMDGRDLGTLLRSVPIGGEGSGVRYGAGVAIRERGPNGLSYGHGGWIPGYVSSLRHYPEAGVTVAFQINTDVGVADDSTDLVEAMERRLAAIAIERLR